MATPQYYVTISLLLASAGYVLAQGGCGVGEEFYAGDWAREGVTISLVKTGNDNTCGRYVTLEMVDEPRFHSNPYAESLAVIVNFPPGPALVVPYVMGKRVYNITLQLQLPCDSSSSCADYIGSLCQQQGVGFYYQMRMAQETGCQGGKEFLGIRDGESFDAATWNFQPNFNAPCAIGNSASYDNNDEGIQDVVANLVPHATQNGLCSWVITTQLAPGPRFRDSDYIDMVSFRGTGLTNYGAGTRMFFKGQEQYVNTLPGAANCADESLDVEMVLLNEFLGAYPNYVTGVSTCPFLTFKRYQLVKGQHYSFVGNASNTGGNTGSDPVLGTYPMPTDPMCMTPQVPGIGQDFELPCPRMLSFDEVQRGFGAFYDSECTVRGGSWAVYQFPHPKTGVNRQSCCRTCRWNKQDAVAAWLQPTEVDDCPPCVKAYYEAFYNGPVQVEPLAPYVSDVQCPYPKSPNGDTSLPTWLYSPQTGKCYYKSSFARGISGNINDATQRCTEVHGGQLLKISSQAEDDFVRLNLLWTGFFGETYTGLRKPGRLQANFTDTWTWADGTPLALSACNASDYQRWAAAPRDVTYSEDVAVCMEYLPQQPKTWNPFGCLVNKHYICERPATNLNPVAPPPPGAAPADCSALPAMPVGAVAPVALVNAGGPAMCNYYAADNAGSQVAVGGGVDNWVGRDTACGTQRAACSIRFGGAFSYNIRTVVGRSYRLRFTFSEVWWNAVGQRVFDVSVNGAVMLANVDPYALAGARFTAAMLEVTLTATETLMVVSLQGKVDNAALAALEVFDMGAAPTQQPSPSPAPVVTPSPSPSPVITSSPSPEPVVTPSPEPVVTPSPSPAPVDGGSESNGGTSGSSGGGSGSTGGAAGTTGGETGTSDGGSGATGGASGSTDGGSESAGGATGTTGGDTGSTAGIDGPTGPSPSPTASSRPSPNPSLLQGGTLNPSAGTRSAAVSAVVKPAVAVLVTLLLVLMV